MTFLKKAGLYLNFGDGAGDTLRSLIKKLDNYADENDLTLKQALTSIEDNFDIEDAEKALLTEFRKWVAKHTSRDIADLLEPVNEIEKRSDEKMRKIGWPSKSWASDVGNVGPFALDLKADGGLYFEVLKDNAQDAEEGNISFDLYEAAGVISMNGKLAMGGDGTVPVPYAGINIKANASLGRGLKYYFGFEKQKRITGEFLGGGISLIRNPVDGASVLSAFQNTSLRTRLAGIVLEGEGSLGGEVGIKANFPTPYGVPGIELNGKASFANNFQYVVTHEDGSDRLTLTVKTHKANSRGIEIGVSYVVGLSTIAPEFAKDLLRNVQGIHEHIVEIDEKASDLAKKAKSWLKPGDIIKAELSNYVKSAIDKASSFAGETPVAALGRLLGVSETADLTSDTIIKNVSEQMAELISAVLDELPDIVEMETAAIQTELIGVFNGIIPANILAQLDTEVFVKVQDEIDAKLAVLSGKLNSETKDAIETFFGVPGSDVVDNLKAFITEAREISQKILDGVSKAQTDLLAAEIGWSRSKATARDIGYKAHFDVMDPEGLSAYETAVLRPSKFGTSLFADDLPGAVTVESSTLTQDLTRISGHHWRIALIGVAMSSKVTSRGDVKVIQTHDGVVVVNSKGNVTKTKSIADETRRISFVSAMNMYEARLRDVRGLDGVTRSEANAPATLKIQFVAEDGKLGRKEFGRLLSEFHRQGMLSDKVLNALKSDYEVMRSANNDKRIKASLSIGLALPPQQVVNVLEYLSEDQNIKKMSSNLSKSRRAIMLAARDVDEEGLSALQEDATFSQNSKGLTERPNGFDMSTDVGRWGFLMFMAQSGNAEAESLGLKRDRVRSRHNRVTGRAKSNIELYNETFDAFENIMAKASALYNGRIFIPETNDVGEVRRAVEEIQEQINEFAKDYLEIRSSIKWKVKFLGSDRVKTKTVMVFKALQYLAKSVDSSNTIPPLMLSLNPENGSGKSYFSLNELRT